MKKRIQGKTYICLKSSLPFILGICVKYRVMIFLGRIAIYDVYLSIVYLPDWATHKGEGTLLYFLQVSGI